MPGFRLPADEEALVEAGERSLARRLNRLRCSSCKQHVYSGYFYSPCSTHQRRCLCIWCKQRST
jgi:hypothetical protein